ncbi:hypothetical protein PIB30_053637 [Stylosanthes scabra]|uniref:Uncharacterized protein n=1 Tax=Stylosanthes scabra TaxID=79078 RepID=A0ABU6WGS2_9FABA|nr:hypothetical protein [Stylosanthes scabra]
MGTTTPGCNGGDDDGFRLQWGDGDGRYGARVGERRGLEPRAVMASQRKRRSRIAQRQRWRRMNCRSAREEGVARAAGEEGGSAVVLQERALGFFNSDNWG